MSMKGPWAIGRGDSHGRCIAAAFGVSGRVARAARADISPAKIRTGNARAYAMTMQMVDTAYRPAESEPFMSERQREYFRRKLLRWKDDILRAGRGRPQ